MRELNLWTFLAYYGAIYLFFLIVLVVGWQFKDSVTPIAALIFPIAQNNSLPKVVLVASGMFWGMVLFYTIVIQRIRLKP